MRRFLVTFRAPDGPAARTFCITVMVEADTLQQAIRTAHARLCGSLYGQTLLGAAPQPGRPLTATGCIEVTDPQGRRDWIRGAPFCPEDAPPEA